MDPNYAMAKFGLESKNILKTKHRGCWYYTKYFFFFLSIIQFLIILGLVLFMLYGNAHGTTENRLSSLQSRYDSLTVDYALLNGNFTQMKSKLASLEKENLNCSDLLTTARRQLQNRTSTFKPMLPMPPFQEACRLHQSALDRCNTTYIIDTLRLKHEQLLLQRDHDRLKENCDQTIFTLTNKGNQTISEKGKLQREKDGLDAQIKYLQSVCTTIDKRFDMVLEGIKNRVDNAIVSHEPLQYPKCWSLSNEINKNIDLAINSLKQDVNTVMFENSQLKTENARNADNIQKCDKEKMAISSEKNNLSRDKGALEKHLLDIKEELATISSKYIKKGEELDNCRKMQSGVRPGVIYSRM